MAELTVGQVVDGRYELEAVIGKGGMGCVFRARHVITHGKVALKVLTDTVDAELQQRFLAEARAASTIGHPAIVAVSDASRTSEGQLYIVMELLSGKPLRSSLQGGLPGDQIRRIGLELLDALGAAHRQGIVHRDLKPENIFLLGGTGAVKVLDFGIAKVLGAATSSTVSGHVLGTLEYMAPEQLLDAARVDGRADLWAVGIILYELIAGVRPFGGATREAKYAALATEEPMAIEDVVPVSPEIAAFFATALARDPAARFQTAAAMAAALRTLAMLPQTSTHAAQTGVGSTLGTGAVQWTNVGSTLGTGPNPGSIPPPPPSGVPYQPHPNASGHALQPSPVAAPSSAKRLVLVGLGFAVAFGLAFAIVMATRKSAPPPERLAEVPADAAPTRAPDAAVVLPATPDAAPVVTGASCEDHCKRLDACQLMRPSCLQACDRPAVKACLDGAKTCEDLAVCHWRNQCPDTPLRAGPKKCIDVRVCLNNYQTDTAQGCALCFDGMTRAGGLVLARWNVCEDNARAERDRANAAGKFDAPNSMSKCDDYTTPCAQQ